HDQLHLTGGRVHRVHVVHVVYTAHLLLDGRGDRLFDRLRVRADVAGAYLNVGRRDLGKQSYWQLDDGHSAHDHHQDRDNHRDDRTVDEKFRHPSDLAT